MDGRVCGRGCVFMYVCVFCVCVCDCNLKILKKPIAVIQPLWLFLAKDWKLAHNKINTFLLRPVPKQQVGKKEHFWITNK